MSWVKINTYNLLDRFQVRTQQEIFKFNQFDNDYNDYNRSLWVQDERDELNYHLKSMFDQMLEWLGFYPRPIWKQIKVPLDQQFNYWDCILTIPESAWLNDFGVRAVELIEGDVSVSITTSPYVTLTITTDEIENGEIAIFHTSSDAFNNTADDRFRILPEQIYYNGTAYIIRIPKARLIQPVLWNTQFNNNDPEDRVSYVISDSGNYVTGVDVYRVYNDDTVKVQLIGPPLDYTNTTTLQSIDASAVILDEKEATFKIQYDDTVPIFNPVYVLVNAYIGHPLTQQNLMYPIIEEFIIRKAKVEMGMNARLSAAKISTQWDFDDLPAYTKPDSNSGRTGIGYRPNPIGALNVDVEMFKQLMPIANWRGKILDKRFWER